MRRQERRCQPTECVRSAAGGGADYHRDGLASEECIILRDCSGCGEEAAQQADADAFHFISPPHGSAGLLIPNRTSSEGVRRGSSAAWQVLTSPTVVDDCVII